MTLYGWAQLGLFAFLLVLLVPPLGWHVARVLEGRPGVLARLLGPVERLILRLAGPAAAGEMSWKGFAAALLVLELVGVAAVMALLLTQHLLPLNPQQLGPVPVDQALNIAISFVTNTNWQSYSGEGTLSPLSQMLALTVQNFLSAAVGVVLLAALTRGFVRQNTRLLGNFWVDLTRVTLYVLLPLALLLAPVLVWQGVVQSFSGYVTVQPVQPAAAADAARADSGTAAAHALLPLGPAASQIAIKQLGTNGGGYFGANSAHPFENPTPLSNFLQCLAILLLPAALTWTFGYLVGDVRQGWALFGAMALVFVPLAGLTIWSECAGNPRLAELGLAASAGADQPGGNMEGKELRFGVAPAALWTAATTATGNGAVNSMLDSYTPLGGLAPLLLIELGCVIFGGIGYGLVGLLMYAVMAVFVAGLAIGRSPEYLGKKIETFEMQMAALLLVVPCIPVLTGTAVGLMLPGTRALLTQDGPHGLTQMLYAFSSTGYTNGSAFAGLPVNTPFFNLATAFAMVVGHFAIALPALALAGRLAEKRKTPSSAGTLPTHTPQFALLLVAVLFVVGALNFVPALSLGPLAEHFQMLSAGGSS